MKKIIIPKNDEEAKTLHKLNVMLDNAVRWGNIQETKDAINQGAPIIFETGYPNHERLIKTIKTSMLLDLIDLRDENLIKIFCERINISSSLALSAAHKALPVNESLSKWLVENYYNVNEKINKKKVDFFIVDYLKIIKQADISWMKTYKFEPYNVKNILSNIVLNVNKSVFIEVIKELKFNGIKDIELVQELKSCFVFSLKSKKTTIIYQDILSLIENYSESRFDAHYWALEKLIKNNKLQESKQLGYMLYKEDEKFSIKIEELKKNGNKEAIELIMCFELFDKVNSFEHESVKKIKL